MNNPFGYIFVPPVLAPTVLHTTLPLSATGIHTLALEQQQQQSLMQSSLVANGLYSTLSGEQSVSNSGSLVKKAKTQHTIVGKPVMYGNKADKKPESQGNDGAQTETTSDYASDEHVSDANSESGTLASTDSGRPDSTRNGASSLSPRTVETHAAKQSLKKANLSPTQTPNSGNTTKNDQSSNSSSRNSAKLIYHRKPENVSVGGGSHNKHENRKYGGSETDATSDSCSKNEVHSQRLKRVVSDSGSNSLATDGASHAKRVKVSEEKITNPAALVSYKNSPEAEGESTTTAQPTSATTTTTTFAVASSVPSSSTLVASELATKSSTTSIAANTPAHFSVSAACGGSAANSTSSTNTVSATVISNNNSNSNVAPVLANDDDMDLDDDGPIEEVQPPPPPPPPAAEPATERSTAVHDSPRANKTPIASLSSATLTSRADLAPSITPRSVLSTMSGSSNAFDGAVTTWVSAPTVTSSAASALASASHFLLPTAVSHSLPSYYNPYAAAAVAAAANQTFTTAPQLAQYQVPTAAAHPLAYLNPTQAGHANAAAAYMQAGAAPLAAAHAVPSLPLALRLQNVANLQQAALQQAAASNYQLQMQAAASQLFAPQATAAHSQLINPHTAAAAAAMLPQQQVLSISEEIDPYRMYLQKR